MLTHLSQSGFRNLKEFSLDFSRGITVISGPNGHGKTNLLEAIHIICQGFSFRTRNIQDAAGWENGEFILRANLNSAEFGVEERALQVANDFIKVKLDGKEFRRATALFGSVPVVTLSPEDISLARGAPEIRRSYLDELLCHQKKSNLDLLRKYRRTLQQRNKWLRDNLSGIDCGGEDLFFALTEQLISLAAAVWEARAELCRALEPLINDFYWQLANNAEAINFSYSKNLSKEEFSKTLSAKAAAEKAAGTTLAGPHKDDIEIMIYPANSAGKKEHSYLPASPEGKIGGERANAVDKTAFARRGFPIREVGSQGQCRSLALAMRLASAEVISASSSIQPILLLDDIFAELDSSRREALARIVREKQCQVFAATPRKEDLPFEGDDCITIFGGQVAISR